MGQPLFLAFSPSEMYIIGSGIMPLAQLSPSKTNENTRQIKLLFPQSRETGRILVNGDRGQCFQNRDCPGETGTVGTYAPPPPPNLEYQHLPPLYLGKKLPQISMLISLAWIR